MLLDAGCVVLRPQRADDRELLLTVLTDPDVMKLALHDRAFNRVEAAGFIESQFAAGDETLGMHVISINGSSEAMGFGGYRRCTLLGVDDVEFGWILAKAHHGHGYATALGYALIQHALETLRLDRIVAACNPVNAPSEHILRDKLKMRFEREVEPRPGFRRRVYSAVSDVCTTNVLKIGVRRASVHDATDVFSLVEEYYEAVSVVMRDGRDKLLADYVQNANGGAWLAYDGTEAVGCILYHPLSGMASAGEVKRLYVRPAFRHRGIAQALLDDLERFASSRGDEWLYLDTNDSLKAAIAFYERNGYVHIPRYNDNPQATIFMRKRLKKAS